MKEEIKAFFAKLGIGKVESNADGVFMKDEDVKKMMLVNESNETLTASLQAEKEGRIADNIAKDTIISVLKTEKDTLTTENKNLSSENTRLTTELAAAKAGETVVKPTDADPNIIGSKKKELTKNESVLAEILASTSETERAMYAPKKPVE